MTRHELDLESSGESTYEARVASLDGSSMITLRLDGLDSALVSPRGQTRSTRTRQPSAVAGFS